jgi:predicted Fe-Mo cluster-binding NifX family protein
MKVALPVFRDRISPVFDAAHLCVLVECREGLEEGWRKIFLTGMNPRERIAALLQEEVDILICGAITGLTRNLAEAAGISVESGITGEVERVLNAFRGKDLDQPCFRMPGCHRRRRRSGRRTGKRRGG